MSNTKEITPQQRVDFPKDGKNDGVRYAANLDKLGCLKLIERHLIGFDWEEVPFNLTQLIVNAFNDGAKCQLRAAWDKEQEIIKICKMANDTSADAQTIVERIIEYCVTRLLEWNKEPSSKPNHITTWQTEATQIFDDIDENCRSILSNPDST